MPFGGSSGPGAEHGLPEYFCATLYPGSSGESTAYIDDIVIDRGYSTENQPRDDLRACLRHIYRDGWPQMYIDSATMVLADPNYTTQDYTDFFSGYLAAEPFNKNLINYLGCPAFGWIGPEANARVQHATLAAFRQAAFDIVTTHSDDLGAAFRQDYQLGETCACLHYWVNELRDLGQMLTPEEWTPVDTDYLAHFGAFPQYFGAAATFDNHTQPWLGAIRAQAWLVAQNMLPLDGPRKAQLVDVWGLTGARAALYEQTGVVLLDNNLYHPNLEALIRDVLLALPPDASDLQAVSCEETLFYGSWADPFGMWRNYVNVNNGDPASLAVNEFPGDVPPSYAPLMAGAVVHEIMHAVDGYHWFGSGSQNSWYASRRAALIESAGCPHMQYLQSNAPDCTFVNAPQEFVAAIANLYLEDTAHTLELALTRWAAGYTQPINQWLLVAELLGRLGGPTSTPFWRIAPGPDFSVTPRRIRWTGDRISRVTVEPGYDGYGWRFEFDTNQMVSAVHPLEAPLFVLEPLAIPAVITSSETSTLVAEAYDADDDHDTLLYHWTPEQGEIVGTGPVVTFVPPPVWEITTIAVRFVVEDPDGLETVEMTAEVEVRPSVGDLNGDGHVDVDDFAVFAPCMAGPDVTTPPPGATAEQFARADIDGDLDVDLVDFGSFQALVQTTPSYCSGDMNCDGRVTFADIDPFVEALGGESAWNQHHPNCPWLNADCNASGTVTFADIDPFVAVIGPTCH